MRYKVIGLKHYINALCTEEGLFFTGFIVYLGRGMWETTMLPLNPMISKICLLLTILFIGMKIIFYDTYSVGAYISLAMGVIGTILIYLNSGYTIPFLWLLVLLGCKNISFEKILKVYLVIVGSITVLALCAALLGVIENLVYKSADRGSRIAFGSVYVTDFASHIFYMILVYCYLKAGQLKVYHYLGIIVITSLVYYFCKTRLDCVSMIVVVVVFGIDQWIKKLWYGGREVLKRWNFFWKWLGIGIMPFMALISMVITLLYQEDNSLLFYIDKLLSGRLRFGKAGLTVYPIKFWGQTVDMIGAGGATKLSLNYFFIDNSYIHVLLRYGLIFTIILLVVYVLCSYKYKGDIYFAFAITLVSMNCTIAHHILDIAYVPFGCAFLAHYIKRKNSMDLNTN